ncbi:unnamed protein product [Spirodela intermedia]|uniref:Uncharacterized protein n=1 Tax=Spirodela intermedia TaxID=51605 RepID=A0ABN7E8C3_SPIIN|nr:unnamed protein product [Spirodela intermedia]
MWYPILKYFDTPQTASCGDSGTDSWDDSRAKTTSGIVGGARSACHYRSHSASREFPSRRCVRRDGGESERVTPSPVNRPDWRSSTIWERSRLPREVGRDKGERSERRSISLVLKWDVRQIGSSNRLINDTILHQMPPDRRPKESLENSLPSDSRGHHLPFPFPKTNTSPQSHLIPGRGSDVLSVYNGQFDDVSSEMHALGD